MPELAHKGQVVSHFSIVFFSPTSTVFQVPQNIAGLLAAPQVIEVLL